MRTMSTHLAHDPFGLPIHVQRPESAAAVDGFIEGFLAYEPRILDVLAAAEHDDSLIVQTLTSGLIAAFVTKPFRHDDIMNAVRAVLLAVTDATTVAPIP